MTTHPTGVLGEWAPVRAPYPRLREQLLNAEACLNRGPATGPTNRWQRVRQAAGDDVACADAVNTLLSAVLAGWELVAVDDGRWRVSLVPASDVGPGELAAAQALVLLVEAGGWSRLGRCARPGCTWVFLDWTSGGNRRTCRADEHQR